LKCVIEADWADASAMTWSSRLLAFPSSSLP